jgi:hypothetical protein
MIGLGINLWRAALGGGAATWSYVSFGESNTRDRLSIATTGADEIANGTAFRAVIRFRPREAPPTATSAYNENLFSFGGLFYCRRVAVTGATLNNVNFRTPLSTSSMTTSAGLQNGEEIIMVVESDSLHGSQVMTTYVDGTLLNTALVYGTPTSSFNTAAAMAIGAMTAGETNEATSFYRGDMSEIRLWFGNAAEAITLCEAHTLRSTVTAKASGTEYTLGTTSRLTVGTVISNSGATDTATVLTISGLDITTTAWALSEPIATELVTWTSAAPEHIDDILNNVIPPDDGAIAGVTPQVYFGGPGTTAADWNAGLNRGTLSAWTGGTVT